MAKLNGTYICPQCKAEIKWEYQIPQLMHSAGIYDVEVINTNLNHPKRVNSIKSDIIELCITCDKCGGANRLVCNADND